MNWFKTLWLTSEERAILKAAKKPEIEVLMPGDPYFGKIGIDKPYKNILYSNGNLTVVFNDGSVISKCNADKELFDKVKNAYSQTVIESLMIERLTSPIKDKIETVEERKLVSNNLCVLKKDPNFIINGTKVLLKGVNLEMPASVIASFIEILERMEAANEDNLYSQCDNYKEQYQALKMFWLKLALNTLPQSREDLLIFVRENDVRITSNGNLILYRKIVSQSLHNQGLIAFITQEYYKIKKAGLDPRNYAIEQINDNTYNLYNLASDLYYENLIGNLQVMYLELPKLDGNDFTSWFGKGKSSIKLGAIYSIPEEGINLNNGICAAGGLHAAAVNYDYSSFGNVAVVVLVNPSKAITVPLNETGKLRTTEMFIACINDKPLGVHFDESAISVFDEEYHDLTLQQLEEALKDKSFETLCVLDNVPAVSLIDLNHIKDMLKNRVTVIN